MPVSEFEKLTPSVQDLLTRPFRTLKATSQRRPGRFDRVPGYVKDYLKPAITPDEAKTPLRRLAERGRTAMNLGKVTLFANPAPHMRNIGFMQALSDPGALPETLATFARIRGGFGGHATPGALR